MITIVDYGMGNLGSISNMFKRIDVASKVTSSLEEIEQAQKILLPGVGAFDAAVNKIDSLGLREGLIKKAKIDKIPFLGICLGMQLLTHTSQEGTLSGLGLIDAETVKFKFEDVTMKVPHMGWNFMETVNESSLTQGFNNEYRFYFVHSYYVRCKNQKNRVSQTEYGLKFDSIIQNENIFGAQFHPEKSHKYGMHLFENFSNL